MIHVPTRKAQVINDKRGQILIHNFHLFGGELGCQYTNRKRAPSPMQNAPIVIGEMSAVLKALLTILAEIMQSQ